MKKLLSFLFFIISFTTLRAQDVHYSMYDFSPLILNAGETGYFEGDWRGTANFREQWKSLGDPFQTISAAYDQHLYMLPGQFSVGLLFINDRSGNIDLINNRIALSFAYKKETAVWDYSVGVQTGLVLKSFGLNGTTFPEQYNDNIGAFDPSLPLSEQNLGNQRNYFNLNAGGLVVRKFRSGQVKLGISAMHLNSPDVSFFEREEKLEPRLNTYIQVRKDLASNLFVRPMILLARHNGAQELLLGGDVGLYAPESDFVDEIFLGIDVRDGFNRNGDAFIASLGFAMDNFTVGLAYDINYSGLNESTNNRGAIEVSLIYISPSTAIKQITIPCDRF